MNRHVTPFVIVCDELLLVRILRLLHVQGRNGEDGLQRRVRLDHTTVVKGILLDVGPDLLRDFRTRHLLPTADGRQPGLLFG